MSIFRLNRDATFDVVLNDRDVIARASAELVYRDAWGEEKTLCLHETRGDELRGANEEVEIVWRSENDTAQVQVCNKGSKPVWVERLRVIAADIARGASVQLAAVSELSYLQHGWQSWSPVRVRPLAAHEEAFPGDYYTEKHLPHGADARGQAVSEWFTVIKRAEESAAVLLGFISAADQLAEIRLVTEGQVITQLAATCFGDGVELAPSQNWFSEKVWIARGEPLTLMEAYATRLGGEMHARTEMRALSGWCSWYYYFGENDQVDLEANLARMRDERLPFDLILLDDGYQTSIGDWTDIRADKFPKGMRAAAETIRAAGFIPGIWLAPFGARHDSRLATEHPQFLLRDAEGQPVQVWTHWYEMIHALDLTHPGVLDYLRELFHTVAHVWGFDLMKLDFIYAGAAAGVHHDRTATRAQAYRRGLAAIREAIGEQKWILGCGAPQATSVGLVDAMRIGQDVSIMWKALDANPSAPSVFHALRNSILRAPFHRKLWVNDPDCVILRTRGNASLLSTNEVRTLATVVALTGEIILDSDNLATVAPARVDDLRRILPPLDRVARPRDLFAPDSLPPAQLEINFQREWGEWRVLAAINWRTRTRELTAELPAGEFHVYDFWSAKYLGIHSRQISLSQAPHATALLVVTRVSQDSQLIASTFHISSGYAEIKNFARGAENVRIELEKAGRQRGELVFAIPREWRNANARVNGRRVKVRAGALAKNVIAVRFTLDERAVVELEVKRPSWGAI